jgi:UDP-glucose 4-epimerase
MKIVITGALGHIGSRLIRTLPVLIPSIKLVLIDDLSTQRYSSLFGLSQAGSCQFHQANILSADLEHLFADAHAVIHLAAITDATQSFDRQKEVEHTNLDGTRLIADACLAAGARLLFPSTTSVYGSQERRVDETCPRIELRPQSPYADSKLAAEEYLTTLSERGLRHTTCRFGTIYGVSPGMRFHTAVNKFCWQASLGIPLTVWRMALHQVRPYLDLKDCIAAIAFLLASDRFDGRVYNVVTENASVSEVIESIRPYARALQIEYVDSQIMNQLSYEVAADRIADAGFRPSGDMKTGIRETMHLLSGVSGWDAKDASSARAEQAESAPLAEQHVSKSV